MLAISSERNPHSVRDTAERYDEKDVPRTARGRREALERDASAVTLRIHAKIAATLSLDDRKDFDRATRGRIDSRREPIINHDTANRHVWDMEQYRFIEGDAPPTVNPSLWRQARLNMNHGLFEVADGIFQVRGYDIANITFVAGETGWIVIDPLSSTETARASKALVDEYLGLRPVHAVIYTHSHGDHFAGVMGILSEEDVATQRAHIIAPDGFMKAAVLENVIVGNAMIRRSGYMYGNELPRGPRGQVDAGLGKADPEGSVALVPPTDLVTSTGEQRTIDNVTITFQMTPGTEAPAEMNLHFPARRALCMAENCSSVMHNLYTLRGSEVRDGLAWSKYIDEAIELFSSESDVVFSTHNWPRFGRHDAREFLEGQRDLYRFIHDQAVRLANHGLSMNEIAERLELPQSLAADFANRGYYGTLSHNAKAVYQRYLGWFDGNPSHLNPLPPEDAAQRYVDAMGGAEAVLTTARLAYDRGEYRWVAELVGHIVFSDAGNAEATNLQADAFEQLGYQAESAAWRNVYLSGASELRYGIHELDGGRVAYPPEVVAAMTVEDIFDSFGVRLNGPAAEGTELSIAWRIVDTGEAWTMWLKNSTVHFRHSIHESASTTVELSRTSLDRLASSTSTLDQEVESGHALVVDDGQALHQFLALLDEVERYFPIVTP